MKTTFPSPFGEDKIYADINDCLPPRLPPPNQEVCKCIIDCTEKSDNTPLDAVDPEGEHFAKSVTVDVSGVGVTTAVVENNKNDYEDPIQHQTKPSFTTVSEVMRNK